MLYPFVDWDRLSKSQRVIRDFTLEVGTLSVCDDSEGGLSYVDGSDSEQTGRISVQACNSTVLKLC